MLQRHVLGTGGRAVLDGIEKQLALHPARLLPSRETLRRYGNTSSSSIWCIPHTDVSIDSQHQDCSFQIFH